MSEHAVVQNTVGLYEETNRVLSLGGRVHILSRFEYRHRAVAHPFPLWREDRPYSENTIEAQVGKLTKTQCWVDLATGQKFMGAFPMEGVVLLREENQDTLEWLLDVEATLRRMLTYMTGPSGHRSVPAFMVYPMFNRQGRNEVPKLQVVRVYAAFEGGVGHEYGPWASVDAT